MVNENQFVVDYNLFRKMGKQDMLKALNKCPLHFSLEVLHTSRHLSTKQRNMSEN